MPDHEDLRRRAQAMALALLKTLRVTAGEMLELLDERDRLLTLLAELTYNGIDRGYVRGSETWADQVRVSARAAGLSEADADILTDAEYGDVVQTLE